jgi:tetratricopeptide (TPR) repeat protein
VLARSGQLKDMIERAEAQLKASPKSVQIQQSLVAYYQAAGDRDKMKAALVKTAEMKPNDAKLRYQVAQQLTQAGDRVGALAHYKAALKLDPAILSNSYYEVQEAFTQANKLEELGQLFDEIDLRKVGHYYYATQPVAALLQTEKTRELGLKLFRKVWDAFPQYRGSILGQLYDESVWRLPEIYTYAKQAAIPREDAEGDPWEAATQIVSYGSEGRVDSVLARLLAIARKQQRLPELRAEVAAGLAKRPDWVAGKALLGVIDVQSGRKDAGLKSLKEAFANPKADVPPLARFIVCQELEYYAGLEDFAVTTLEAGADDIVKDGNYDFSYSPARRLAWWYTHVGRPDDARKFLRRVARTEATDPGYSGGYWQYRVVNTGMTAAQELTAAGDPIEAVRIYNKLLADKEGLAQANQYGGGDRMDQQLEQGAQGRPQGGHPGHPAGRRRVPAHPAGRPGRRPGGARPGGHVPVRDAGKATLDSLFVTALKSTEKAPAVRADALAKLAELVKKYPADVSVHTAAAAAAFADGKPGPTREAVDRLVKVIEAAPLDALPPSGKPNARQRAEATAQVPVWLVARECLAQGRDDLRPTGEALAARALLAARRCRTRSRPWPSCGSGANSPWTAGTGPGPRPSGRNCSNWSSPGRSRPPRRRRWPPVSRPRSPFSWRPDRPPAPLWRPRPGRRPRGRTSGP